MQAGVVVLQQHRGLMQGLILIGRREDAGLSYLKASGKQIAVGTQSAKPSQLETDKSLYLNS